MLHQLMIWQLVQLVFEKENNYNTVLILLLNLHANAFKTIFLLY